MAANPNQLAFNKLNQLITFRQELEKQHPSSVYSSYPTTIDFPDVYGHTLLRYAIRLGDLIKVGELVEAGADTSKGLLWALGNNQLEIAKFMLGKGSDFDKIKLEWIQKEPCRTWFGSLLLDRLDAMKCKKHNPLSFFRDDLVSKEWLRRAAESGLADALRPHTSKKELDQYFNSKNLLNKLGCLAAANNRVEVLELLKQQGHHLTPHDSWKNSPLISSVRYKNTDAAAYLLEQGVDPNYFGEKKRNALMAAAETQSPELTAMLLKAGADVSARDYHGRTALHICCQQSLPNTEVVSLLSSAMQEMNLNELYDIFGMTPLDYARKNGCIASIITSKDTGTDIMPARCFQVLSQHVLLEKIDYYLKLSRRNMEFCEDGGHCNGFTWLHAFYVDNNMEDYYFNTLELIAGWDGSQEQLDEPFEADMPQTEYYCNLGDLFEQWSNDLIWFQNSEEIIKKTYVNPLDCDFILKQSNRKLQYEIAGNLPYKHLMMSIEKIAVDTEQLHEIIEIIIKRYPRGAQIFLAGGQHIVSIRINDGLVIHYYDCNFPHRTLPLDNAQSLVDLFINTKYMLLQKGTLWDGKLYISMDVSLHYFDTPDMRDNIARHQAFAEYEIPCSEEEVSEFQKRSPNKYTPMHIAVLSGSLISVQSMLQKEEQLQQLKRTSAHGLTPVEIAINSDNISITSAFIEYSKTFNQALELDKEPGSYILDAWLQRKSELFELLLLELPDTAKWNCFIEAIKQGYAELVFQFIKEKRIDLKESPDYSYLALVSTLTSKHTQRNTILTWLLESGASMLYLPPEKHYTDSPLNFLADADDAMLNIVLTFLTDINAYDSFGNALIHFLNNHNLFANEKWMSIILNKANFALENRKGETIFVLVLKDDFISIEKKMTLMNIILKKFIPVYQDEKIIAMTINLMYLAMHNNNIDLFRLILDGFPKENLNRFCQDKYSNGTLLHWSIVNRKNDFIEALLLAGADVHMRSTNGNTCLHLMVQFKNPTHLDIFYQKGADILVENNKNETTQDLLMKCEDDSLFSCFSEYWQSLNDLKSTLTLS